MHSSLVYRSVMVQVSSAHIAVASPRAAISASANSSAFPLEMASAYSGTVANHFPLDASFRAVETTSKGLLGLIRLVLGGAERRRRSADMVMVVIN